MKRNADPRYYVCPNKPCMGQVAPVLEDAERRPVFLCSQCGARFPQTRIDQEYRLLKFRDAAAG